jgi:predicted Zn-dependent protease
MRERFLEIADHVFSLLKGSEVALVTFDGEVSDFVRFNKNAVRQAGCVRQQDLGIDLIDGQRHAEARIALTGEIETDSHRVAAILSDLRSRLPVLPEDPHLLYATEVRSTERLGSDELVGAEEALGAILAGGAGQDSVGLYAQGPIHRGFANSLGQRNWFSAHTFNLEWCFYLRDDKAVKSDYAGFTWDAAELARRMEAAGEQLALLDQTPKTIEPGKYRVYLAPSALQDVVGLLGWSGFGLKDHKAKISSLIRMTEGDATMHAAVSLAENTGEGVAPNFDGRGFVKPEKVVMIEQGRFKDCLASPRSAKEYGVETNGASPWEAPESLDMQPGELPDEEVLARLGTGLYINNLHYLNYSDRPACRMTGMTRFATFWVENGKLAAPLNVMRFDESVYRLLGSNLVGLTRDRAMILSSSTYGGREVASSRVPGALIEDFTLTL